MSGSCKEQHSYVPLVSLFRYVGTLWMSQEQQFLITNQVQSIVESLEDKAEATDPKVENVLTSLIEKCKYVN